MSEFWQLLTYSQVWLVLEEEEVEVWHRRRPPPGTWFPPCMDILQTPTQWQGPGRTSCWHSWRKIEPCEHVEVTAEDLWTSGHSQLWNVWVPCVLATAGSLNVLTEEHDDKKTWLLEFKSASDSARCFRLTEDETKEDFFLQVLHHHLSPGEVTEGVRSIVRVGFPLTAPRPHAHFIQDVFQLYFTANIWRKRRGGGSQWRNSYWACGGSTF